MREEPEARETLVEAQALLHSAIANASEAEAAAIIRIFRECLDQESDR
ncbi:hypothetical protein [Trichocoleus sp. FACHB-262]|nr:hypothetical protein [Trichocoleus sp. FACHB-262]MBD2123948.1 hypothetical protein [Trichocoleus sp. FACHB-262]